MRRLFLLALLCAGLPGGARADEPADPIRAGYELFYRGDLRGAYDHFRALAERDPDNLAAAYGALSAVYVRDQAEEALEAEFDERADALLRRAGARLERNPQDGEALFYLAQTHGLRAGYRFQRQKDFFGAVRDATKSKHYSEAYVQLDPGRADAYLGLGLYNYYADIAPAFLKLLRVLLFIPGGDRTLGLEQLERAAREGELWAPQAKLELIQIYGWLEGRVDEAVGLAEALAQAYPENPEIGLRLARLYAGPAVEDYGAAAEQLERLLARAEARHPHYPAAIRFQALLALAEVRAQQWRLQEAITLLETVIDSRPADPAWALPRALLARGRYRALLDQSDADADARRVLAEPRWKDKWHEPARRQLEWAAARRASGEAARYAELVPGNRLVAEGRAELAAKFYKQQQQLHPDDPHVRYRLARLRFLRGEWAEAEGEFSRLADKPGSSPDWLRAGVLLHLARLHDVRGEREAAVKLYRKVADDYESESAALAARLGLVTPYRPQAARSAARIDSRPATR